jgi:Ca2+-binding EF-hand superfamily protein
MFGWSIGMVLAVGTMAGISAAGNGQSAGNLAGAKQWLTATDPDNDGTVDHKEFNAYMDAQFAKADTENDGTLDAKELRKNLRWRAISDDSRFRSAAIRSRSVTHHGPVLRPNL